MLKTLKERNLKIFCVLRKSNLYDVDYVERLKRQVDKYAPGVPFHCISDCDVPIERVSLRHSWTGWWSKMELFRPDIEGDIFFLDLDTVICSAIWDLLNVGELTMLSDFFKPARLASGLMYLPESARSDAWKLFSRSPNYWINKHKIIGDQAFLEQCFSGKARRWQELFPNRVISYKADKVPIRGVPKGTGILCFHGKPKPRDINWEVKGLKIP